MGKWLKVSDEWFCPEYFPKAWIVLYIITNVPLIPYNVIVCTLYIIYKVCFKVSGNLSIETFPVALPSPSIPYKWSYSVSNISMFLSSVQKGGSNKEPISVFFHSGIRLSKCFNWYNKFIVMIVYLVAEFMSGIHAKMIAKTSIMTLMSTCQNSWLSLRASAYCVLWKQNWKYLTNLWAIRKSVLTLCRTRWLTIKNSLESSILRRSQKRRKLGLQYWYW